MSLSSALVTTFFWFMHWHMFLLLQVHAKLSCSPTGKMAEPVWITENLRNGLWLREVCWSHSMKQLFHSLALFLFLILFTQSEITSDTRLELVPVMRTHEQMKWEEMLSRVQYVQFPSPFLSWFLFLLIHLHRIYWMGLYVIMLFHFS